MEVRTAKIEDIKQIVALQKSCHVSNLEESDKSDGFLNTVLGEELLKSAIEQEQAVFVAEHHGTIVGMAVCASWQFWRCSEALTKVANDLGTVEVKDVALTSNNSYFWGPVCVSKECRGQGAFEQLFTLSSRVKRSKYPYVYTYVHQDNTRSFTAHTQKVGFQYTKDFELNGQIFQEMIRPIETY